MYSGCPKYNPFKKKYVSVQQNISEQRHQREPWFFVLEGYRSVKSCRGQRMKKYLTTF
jgi:hypothetical protein